ncbi:MAG TPA: molybdenum cofactor biosynthesis protein MoaE [Tepidisphaeraceae bacterium]|nr:molybdenum cofactor biosynthesis protein MoaE [Tepidisphaeraceae bacterium]
MTTDWIELISEAISPAQAAAFVADPAAGGIAIFVGTTRADANAKGHALIALHYEAYVEMALEQLQNLAREARGKWPIAKLAILHRIGPVLVAEPSVLVAVSTPHRTEAFEACHWIIDRLKETAAIWKMEKWANGAETWIDPKSGPLHPNE